MSYALVPFTPHLVLYRSCVLSRTYLYRDVEWNKFYGFILALSIFKENVLEVRRLSLTDFTVTVKIFIFLCTVCDRRWGNSSTATYSSSWIQVSLGGRGARRSTRFKIVLVFSLFRALDISYSKAGTNPELKWCRHSRAFLSAIFTVLQRGFAQKMYADTGMTAATICRISRRLFFVHFVKIWK